MEILSSTAATPIVQNVPATEETVSEESMKTDDKETEMEDLETTYDTGLHETGFNDTETLHFSEGGER